MFVIVALWLAWLLMLFSRPVYALKMIAAFLIGATIGLGLLAFNPPFGRSLKACSSVAPARRLASISLPLLKTRRKNFA
jgi:hypothetical protein